jgi:SAM-dependent methyltransferase
MARAGATVVASDLSRVFIERARGRSSGQDENIAYHVVDVTDEAQILALGERASFDGAACTMALHDIADVAPMASALRVLLKPSGRFVFSVMHPAFNGTNPVFVTETCDDGGVVKTRYALKIYGYAGRPAELGIGIAGQPEPHWYFPRTFAELLRPVLAEGWMLDGLEEPALPPEFAAPERPSSWAKLTGIPPVLVCRLRPPQSSQA